MRWVGPALCLLVASGTWAGLNLSDDGPVWVLVGLDRLVGPSPEVQAAWTWRGLAVLGLLWGGALWWRGSGLEGGADAAPDP